MANIDRAQLIVRDMARALEPLKTPEPGLYEFYVEEGKWYLRRYSSKATLKRRICTLNATQIRYGMTCKGWDTLEANIRKLLEEGVLS